MNPNEKQNQFPKDKAGNIVRKPQESLDKNIQKPLKDDLLKDKEKRK